MIPIWKDANLNAHASIIPAPFNIHALVPRLNKNDAFLFVKYASYVIKERFGFHREINGTSVNWKVKYGFLYKIRDHNSEM